MAIDKKPTGGDSSKQGTAMPGKDQPNKSSTNTLGKNKDDQDTSAAKNNEKKPTTETEDLVLKSNMAT